MNSGTNHLLTAGVSIHSIALKRVGVSGVIGASLEGLCASTCGYGTCQDYNWRFLLGFPFQSTKEGYQLPKDGARERRGFPKPVAA